MAIKKNTKEKTEVKRVEAEIVETKKYVVTSPVNFRKEPSFEAEIIRVLFPKTEVEVTSIEDGWAKASCDGKNGFIKAEFITESK